MPLRVWFCGYWKKAAISLMKWSNPRVKPPRMAALRSQGTDARASDPSAFQYPPHFISEMTTFFPAAKPNLQRHRWAVRCDSPSALRPHSQTLPHPNHHHSHIIPNPPPTLMQAKVQYMISHLRRIFQRNLPQHLRKHPFPNPL